MPVSVRFRGICMFCTKDGRIQEVLLPDTEGAKPRESTQSGRHLDGAIARPHFAGVLVIPSDVSEQREKVRGATITIRVTGEDPPVADLKHLPQLDGTELKVDRSAPHASVKLAGGKVKTALSKKGRPFSFGIQSGLHDHVNVTFDQPVTLTITRGAEKKTFRLQPDTDPVVYVYNFDSESPTPAELDTAGMSNDDIIFDHDFKWHFLLAVPKSITGTRPLTRWSRGALPCPRSDANASIKTVAGSTCYPTTIVES